MMLAMTPPLGAPPRPEASSGREDLPETFFFPLLLDAEAFSRGAVAALSGTLMTEGAGEAGAGSRPGSASVRTSRPGLLLPSLLLVLLLCLLWEKVRGSLDR